MTTDASDSHSVSYSPVGGKMPKPAMSFAGGDGEEKVPAVIILKQRIHKDSHGEIVYF